MHANHVEITGNLASRPEVRKLPSGTEVANARIAQSYSYGTKGETKRHTNWFSLAFYGELARTAVRLNEGDEVNVVGTIQQREFTAKDGSTRKVYEIVVKEYRLIESSNRTESNRSAENISSLRRPNDAWAIL